MLATRRYRIYQCLLERGIPSNDVSKALLDSLKADDIGDLSLPKLLLEHGAAVGYKKGSAFSLALQANSLEAVKLLSQYLVDDITAGIVFNRVRKTASLDPHARGEVYRCLLQWNIDKTSMYHALVDSLKSSHPDVSVVRLLLAKGADPNKNEAHCFIMAATAELESTFRALSKIAEPSVVLEALLNYFKTERDVVRWFEICLAEQPLPAKIDQNKLLVQCMRKFPQTTSLLELLLRNGLSSSARVPYIIYTDWKPEPCTPLIWALFSLPRIENDVIIFLLKRGGNAGMLHDHHIQVDVTEADKRRSTPSILNTTYESICSFCLLT